MAKKTETTAVLERYAPNPELANAVHLVTQSKGGVGKSFVAKCLAEFVASTGRTPSCFDADPANHTFAGIQALNVKVVDLVEHGDIKRRKFDDLLEEIVELPGPYVVDTGSSTFYALWSYITSNNLFEAMENYGRPVILHVPIAPPPDLDDTLAGFLDICELAPDASVVVWLNEKSEPIRIEGESFSQWSGARKNEGKLRAAMFVEHREPDLHGQDVVRMLKDHRTFEEAIFDARLRSKDRLREVKSAIFRQLEEAGI